MSDFKQIFNLVIELLSIELPIFGFRLSILSVLIGVTILSIAVSFIVSIFRG